MNEPVVHWNEEEIIDALLTHLSDREQMKLEQHIRECRECERLYLEWAARLAELMPAAEPERQIGLPRRLRVKAGVHAFWKKLKKSLKRRIKRRLIGLAAALAFCSLLVFGFYESLRQTEDVPNAWLHEVGPNHNPSQIVMDPASVQYVAETALDYDGTVGYVWLNRSTNDLLMMLNGLAMLNDRDYQAWQVRGNVHWNIGLLKLEYNTGYLYVKNIDVSGADRISISLEPKGGSLKPTGPEKIWVQLR